MKETRKKGLQAAEQKSFLKFGAPAYVQEVQGHSAKIRQKRQLAL
jgi:hypothetical protein